MADSAAPKPKVTAAVSTVPPTALASPLPESLSLPGLPGGIDLYSLGTLATARFSAVVPLSAAAPLGSAGVGTETFARCARCEALAVRRCLALMLAVWPRETRMLFQSISHRNCSNPAIALLLPRRATHRRSDPCPTAASRSKGPSWTQLAASQPAASLRRHSLPRWTSTCLLDLSSSRAS